jgi:hypothetical protein
VPSADLFAESQAFPLGGRQLPAPPPAERFLHACLHMRIQNNPLRLLSVRDVAQCAPANDVDWKAVQQLSAKWQISWVVSEAIRTAQEVLNVSLGGSARPLANYQPSARERWLLRAYGLGDAPTDRFANAELPLATLAVTPGLVAKADYIYNLILPGPQYFFGQNASRWARWRRAAKGVAAQLASRRRPSPQ